MPTASLPPSAAVTADPVALRPALPCDAAAIGDVWLRSFDAALPTVRRAHSDDEVRGWVREVLLPGHEVWVAEAAGAVVGVLALSRGWVDQLYLEPAWRGRGIGDLFVALARRRQPAGSAAVDLPGQRGRPALLRAARVRRRGVDRRG